MEKLLTALKGINKFGLAIVLLTAITLMSFTASEKKAVGQKYGYNQSLDQWELIEGLTMDNDPENPAPNTYRCDESDEICSGNFITPPTSGSDVPDSDVFPGDFSLNQ